MISVPRERALAIGWCMDWEDIQNRWDRLKGAVKARWELLSDEEIDRLAGNRDALIEKVKARYGLSYEEAELDVSRWESSVPRGITPAPHSRPPYQKSERTKPQRNDSEAGD